MFFIECTLLIAFESDFKLLSVRSNYEKFTVKLRNGTVDPTICHHVFLTKLSSVKKTLLDIL